MKEIKIDGRAIGPAHKPYIIAELSANHNGSIEKAFETIEMAKKAGADAIKLQTYTPDTMTINCDKEDFQVKGGLWDGYKLYDLYKWAHTPFEWHKAMFEKAREIGITVFSTPFDESAVDLLEELDAPAYKIASFELTDLPLIKRVAQTGKPMIMSTGMANYQEISEAVTTARENGCDELVVLHCISGYPSPVEQANLATIPKIENDFNCIAGLSDHTLGTVVSVASIAMGASLIEKHVTMSRAEKGPDSEFSLEPQELATLCRETEAAWLSIGKAGYERKPVEEASMKFRRSIYFVRSIKAGDAISKSDIRRVRPGYGLPPKYFDELIGKRVNKDVDFGDATSWELIENDN
ncbi:pseudaminic acid synthase [Vibrio aquaticus]|uniref:Pseudaminic acid synthase n=1 Tax=Vibrio aquaticus TaxID=2496559 RepID=A0A3S0N491_9VIBR|nr:pseudaminic acid synthase [Vibrio aquaticus]RTZ14793.1 pseudaminic acid synthase [Vibrio aquaticus]